MEQAKTSQGHPDVDERQNQEAGGGAEKPIRSAAQAADAQQQGVIRLRAGRIHALAVSKWLRL